MFGRGTQCEPERARARAIDARAREQTVAVQLERTLDELHGRAARLERREAASAARRTIRHTDAARRARPRGARATRLHTRPLVPLLQDRVPAERD